MLGKLPEHLLTFAAHAVMKSGSKSSATTSIPCSKVSPKVLQMSRCKTCCCSPLSSLSSKTVLSAMLCSRSRRVATSQQQTTLRAVRSLLWC